MPSVCHFKIGVIGAWLPKGGGDVSKVRVWIGQEGSMPLMKKKVQEELENINDEAVELMQLIA